MNTLDSRLLQYTDCYAQKFASPDRIHYQITTIAGACLPVTDTDFTIEVKGCTERKQGHQHTVIVRREKQRFVAEPAQLQIEVGDMVLWCAADSSVPGFTVHGAGDYTRFDSSALAAEAVYTHAFGMPGQYKWVDANGGGVSGVVEVRSLDSHSRDQCENWIGALAKGTLVTICGNQAMPQRIEILTGQTVFWAVESAAGISITDARLV